MIPRQTKFYSYDDDIAKDCSTYLNFCIPSIELMFKELNIFPFQEKEVEKYKRNKEKRLNNMMCFICFGIGILLWITSAFVPNIAIIVNALIGLGLIFFLVGAFFLKEFASNYCEWNVVNFNDLNRSVPNHLLRTAIAFQKKLASSNMFNARLKVHIIGESMLLSLYYVNKHYYLEVHDKD